MAGQIHSITQMGILELLKAGGVVMLPLLICSLAVWAVIFERLWRYRRLGADLKSFHLEAINAMLRADRGTLRSLFEKYPELPTADLLKTAMDRLEAGDVRLRANWREALERRRKLLNQELRSHLWILGTVASAAPFIGLFGTVVGILRSFGDMAQTGQGGFATVAGGISEALVATATGILVAVVAVLAYNTFQTRWSQLVLLIRLHTEEFAEALEEGRLGRASEVEGE